MYGSVPYGAAPYGASGSTSGARSSPIVALLAGNLHVLMEHIMWFRPFDPAIQMARDIYVSGGWYRTGSADTFPTGEDAQHLLMDGILVRPPNRETRILASGEVNYGASTYGQCTLADTRREYTSWLAYNWKNAAVRHFMGEPSWPLASFAEVFSGVATALDPEPDRVNIGLRDIVERLVAKDYQSNRYAGRGPCVRLNGTTSWLSGTVTCPANSMTIGIRVRSRGSIASDQAIMGWNSGSAAGERRIRTAATNAITIELRNDAGTQFTATAGGVLVTYQWKTLWAILDTSAMTFSLYEGADANTPLATVAVTGTFATVLTTFGVGRLPDAASNFLAADVDELTVWNKALDSVERAKWTGERPPSGTTNLLCQWSLTEGTGGTAYEAGGAGPNLTINSGAWVDSLTGGAELQGKCIPKGRGIRRKVAPVVLSAIDSIYQVAETFDHIATDSLGPILEDGGIRVWTLLGIYTDPWAATPAAGQYMEIPTMGMIRLGSAPGRQLTCDVYLTSATDLPTIVKAVVEVDGGLTAGSQVDEGAANLLPTTNGVGYLAGLDRMSVDDVLIEYLKSVKGWRAPNQLGALTFGVISPTEDLVPDEEATGADFVLDGIKPVFTLPAARAALIRYRPYGITQDPASVNPTLTEVQKQDLQQDFRSYTTPDSLAVLAADPAADVAVRDTVLDDIADAQTQAANEAAWRAVARRTDFLPYTDPVPKYYVGEVLRITMPVLDYDNGKVVIVTATIADDGTGSHGCEVTGALEYIGGDALLVDSTTGDAFELGDGTGDIIL